MVKVKPVRGDVFLDASYAIALAAPTDQLHHLAIALASRLEEDGTRLVTTQAVLLEIGNALSKRRHRESAVLLLTSLEADPLVEVVAFTPDLYKKAFHLYRTRPDKEWGLIDCASFVVMRERGLSEALTADEHFEQAGFRALMREP
jgi:predicted nucleic acid-binding protein